MTFDVSTLAFAGGIVAFATGLFLFSHWWQARADVAALWWAASSSGMGLGVILLALQASLPVFAPGVVAPLILDVCASGIWGAARIFNRDFLDRRSLSVAVGAWIAILILAGAAGYDRLAAILGLAISAAFYAAAAMEFWRARSERLRGRGSMIFLLSLEAMAIGLFAVDKCVSPVFLALPSIGWLGIIHFVGLIFAGCGALSLVTMLKDRNEIKHRAAALTDPLTGLLNRRAFTDRAQRLLERNMRAGTPISLLAFDLDGFKKINDTFGHPTGDHVMRIFAGVLSRAARPADLAGRVGGEEFALALPGCSVDAALVIARRICSAFQDDARLVNGQAVNATVSAGIATAPDHGTGLAEINRSADKALYVAKNTGRNRVIVSALNPPYWHDPPITRIA